MSDLYQFEDVGYFAEKAPAEGDRWRRVAVGAVIVVLALFLAFELVYYLIVVPATAPVNLTVRTTGSVGYNEVCAMAGITGRERWASFDAAEIASRLAGNPVFERVSVEKSFPDRVSVTLVERVPVAISFAEIGGKTVPIEIDRAGVAFRVGSSVRQAALPLLTGLTFENFVPGTRLNPALKGLLEQITLVEERNPVLLASVSEIKVDQKPYGGYDLVVYPVHVPVRVRTDKTLNEDALQYMMLVLDVVKDMRVDVDEIDIRAGTVSYRAKGEAL